MAKDGKMKRQKINNLVMFDFDDTLAKTFECTLVRDKETDRIVDHLYGQAEHDNHVLKDKHYMDYSEFDGVSDLAQPIKETINLLKELILDEKTKVIVLTARQSSSTPAISGFLGGLGIDTSVIDFYGCGGSRLKAGYLDSLLANEYSVTSSVMVFEDSINNITDMLQLEYAHPDISFDFIHVVDELDEKKNYPKGKYGTEKYQKSLKRLHPTMKRRLLGLGKNDYLIKGSKKITDFSRSKSAPPSG